MLDYIIVQAGGKGTRLEHLTKNKPKCLVPINNLPMLFHLFKKYPDKKYIIIGDYKYDVLKKYLKVFAKVQYLLVDARGKNGTCAGIREAINFIPEKTDFLLMWSDLVLPESLKLPENSNDYIGISKDFVCRWQYKDNRFDEIASDQYGVAGFFIFSNKKLIDDVPENGEFVRYLQGKNIQFEEFALYQTKEYGLLSEYNKIEEQKSRPFNKLTAHGDRITKEPLDKQGEALAVREKSWYQFVQRLGYSTIPKIYSYDPFEMEKIEGSNIYEFQDVSVEEKRRILKNIIDELNALHALDSVETDYFSIKEAYFTKTYDRLSTVRDLIPFADDRYIIINGKKCRNVFYYWDELEDLIDRIAVDRFVLLHGDCTFSNMMLRESGTPVFIDPRGYFGYTQMYGDERYDWSKLYYSVVGNYDNFNLKKFNLNISESEVELSIEKNGWEELKDDFFELIPDINSEEIKLIHSIIWLSLTTYAWENYDSICGAFYQGLYYLEELWN